MATRATAITTLHPATAMHPVTAMDPATAIITARRRATVIRLRRGSKTTPSAAAPARASALAAAWASARSAERNSRSAELNQKPGRLRPGFLRNGVRCREADVIAGSPGKHYFCWALLACAVLECSLAVCACCWAWVECSLPLACSLLPWAAAAARCDFAADS